MAGCPHPPKETGESSCLTASPSASSRGSRAPGVPLRHGRGAPVEVDAVTERDKAICARLAPLLREQGLVLAGLDVIGDCLTEINVTSPTGLREIDALTGSHLAAGIVAWAEPLHVTAETR